MRNHTFDIRIEGAIVRAALVLLSMLLLSSCLKDDVPELIPIGWSVDSADELTDGQDTKALVDSYIDLRDACTQDEDGYEKIGVFGSYISSDGVDETVFDDVDLWWWTKEDGNPFNDELGDQSYWNYEGEGEHWVKDADYRFRAYFPKSKVTLQPGSDVDRFLVVYDTQVSQFDMMVASRSLKSASENPVKLLFYHTLAALRFDFQFVESGITDKLKACWLENAASDGFYTSSTLNYEDEILWPVSTPNPVGSRMYYWEPANPMLIESGSASVAYSSFANTGTGGLYIANDGWVLAIPQILKGPESLKLCFKTETGGNEVFSVGLPAGEIKAGNRYTFHVKVSSTSVDLELTITDWNERKSSHYIDFNE